MIRRTGRIGALVAAVLALLASTASGAAPLIVNTPEMLFMPRAIVPVLSSEADRTSLSALAGSEAELTGYLLPVDREGELVYQFALVPFAGACSHMPAPPSGAVVLVTPDKPYRLESVYEHVAVKGRLKLRSELSQLFILDGVVMLKSDYVIAGAEVRQAAGGKAKQPSGGSPWKFLNK